MAIALITKTLLDNTFSVTTSTSGFSKADDELMSDFGEPLINFGGDIEDGTSFVLYTLTDNNKEIKSDMPVKVDFAKEDYNALYNAYSATTAYTTGERVLFSARYYEALQATTGNDPAPGGTAYWKDIDAADDFAQTLAENFATNKGTEMQTAMTTLRAKTDDFSAETEITI